MLSGIFCSSGKIWKEQRTFAFTSLRSFGFGKKSFETKILEEIEIFLQILLESKEQPIDINIAIGTSVSNIICSIALGKQHEDDDPKFLNLLEGLQAFVKYAPNAMISELFPFLKYLPGDLFKRTLVHGHFRHCLDTMTEYIEEHKKTFDENNIRDYIDCYIKELRSGAHKSTTFTGNFILLYIS